MMMMRRRCSQVLLHLSCNSCGSSSSAPSVLSCHWFVRVTTRPYDSTRGLMAPSGMCACVCARACVCWRRWAKPWWRSLAEHLIRQRVAAVWIKQDIHLNYNSEKPRPHQTRPLSIKQKKSQYYIFQHILLLYISGAMCGKINTRLFCELLFWNTWIINVIGLQIAVFSDFEHLDWVWLHCSDVWVLASRDLCAASRPGSGCSWWRRTRRPGSGAQTSPAWRESEEWTCPSSKGMTSTHAHNWWCSASPTWRWDDYRCALSPSGGDHWERNASDTEIP